MASKSVVSPAEIQSKQDLGEVESKEVMSAKGPPSGGHMSVGIEAKQDMSSTVADTKADLFLDQLQVDVTGTIVFMIGRKWDVNAVTGRYLSTDFVVSDAKGNAIHCTARSNVTHNFLRLKEGDVAGYITNVGRTTYQKSGSRNLDFYLANHRGQSIRVTLWGALGDVLIEKKAKQTGMCPIVLTSANAKYYNNKLYLSSSSSTMIFDDADIPAVKSLMTNMPASVEESKKFSVPIDHSAPREATLENLLIYRLELDVADDTAHAVVVMFDEPATTLVECSAESVMEDDNESSDDQSNLPPALANLIGTSHTLEIKSHTYYEYGTFKSFTCWTIVPTEGVAESASSSTLDAAGATEIPKLKSVTQDPSVSTPSNPSEKRPMKRIKIEDSESEDRGNTSMQMVIDESEEEDNCGSAECGTKKKDRMHSNKKKKTTVRMQSTLLQMSTVTLYPNMFLVVYHAFRYAPDEE
ncbi:DNA helicase PIF1, ATP-dependent [Tanacetum coccineum]